MCKCGKCMGLSPPNSVLKCMIGCFVAQSNCQTCHHIIILLQGLPGYYVYTIQTQCTPQQQCRPVYLLLQRQWLVVAASGHDRGHHLGTLQVPTGKRFSRHRVCSTSYPIAAGHEQHHHATSRGPSHASCKVY